MSTLYLIRGISGSGKSTLARRMKMSGMVDAVQEADIYMTDEYQKYEFNPEHLQKAHTACQYQSHKYLEMGFNIAVANTSTTEREVAVYKQIADASGATFVSIVLENRSGNINVHNVPEETLTKQRNRFSVKL